MSSKKKRVGKYLIMIGQVLGTGSFSKVCQGIVEETGQPVAVKVLDKQKIQEDQYTKSAFYKEIEIMKRLNSQYIIHFYDIIESKSNYYVFMEYAPGGDLRSLMKERKIFGQEQTLKLIGQILEGFREIVKYGVIHRDLKPQNILIKDAILKIADFGFARQSDNNSLMQTILGSPLYMSPQLLSKQSYSYKCDIWAIGVISYELCIGRPPWTIKTNNMLQNIKASKLQFPPQIKISQKLQHFIRGCLQYQEESRFDWEKIYMHDLFAVKFKQNFTGDREDSIKLAFIFTGLRMAIHSKNIDMPKFLSNLPEKFSYESFTKYIGLLDDSLNGFQMKLLYNGCLKRAKKGPNQNVTKEDLRQCLRSINVRMKPFQKQILKTEEQIDSTVILNSNYILFEKLRRIIDTKHMNIQKIYEQDSKKMVDKDITMKEFAYLIRKIDPNLANGAVQTMFTEFDLTNKKKITFSEFIRTICKIAGVINGTVDDN